jgi:sugar phosphate isomerase/epimerase
MKFISAFVLAASCLLAGPSLTAAPELGLQAWTFRTLTFAETLDQAHALGIRHLQAYSGQELGGGLAGKFSHTMDAATLAKVLALAKASEVALDSYGVITPKDEAEWTVLFAFAQAAGLKEIVTEARADMLAAIAPAAEKAGIKISLHNHPEPSIYARPETALAAIAKLGDRFGLCADTGHWARTGLDPVASLRLAKGRINSLHLKDIAERGKPSRDLPWGTGTSNVAGQLAELREQGFNGIAYIEYEHGSPALFAEVGRCVAFFNAALPLSTDDLRRGLPAPAGYSADAHAVFAPGRGRDSARWPVPQPLFARDLSNADLQPGAWAFNAGGILAPTRPAGAKPNGDLWTKESYGDFVVSLEFRTQEKSNSGVFLRSSDIVNWLQNSIEIQILQGEEDTPVHLVGAVFDVAAPAREVAIVPGEWYRCVITAKGSLITVVLNGEEVNKVNLDEWKEAGRNPDGSANKFTKAYKDMARSGRLGLQDHGSPIEFRNLFVERL